MGFTGFMGLLGSRGLPYACTPTSVSACPALRVPGDPKRRVTTNSQQGSNQSSDPGAPMSITTAIRRMEALDEQLAGTGDARRHFHSVYLRTTYAIAEKIRGGGFVDPDWVEHWDVVFADLYLDA